MALLEIADVVVRFGGVVAVNEATLSVEAGLVTGLIGPNGAGKTTLFNVVSGMQPPASGTVHFDGRDITSTSTFQRARLGIARTFQRLEAFGSLSVHDNVLTAAEIHHRWRKSKELPTPGATAKTLMLRIGLNRWSRQQADSVPTGTARLLELARAQAIEPKLLLLDEPSSGLGEDETEEFGTMLRELAAAGRAVLMVEHDMDLVMSVCDTIYVFEFGRVIANGTPAEIRANPKVQEAYLGTQHDAAAANGDKAKPKPKPRPKKPAAKAKSPAKAKTAP